MTAGPANLIKAQIKSNLDLLVTAGTLGLVVEKDINTDPLDDSTTISNYPCAFLGTSDMQSNWEYQQANKRTYTFEVLVVQLLENLTDVGQMEDLRDAIALQFDNAVTLNGAAPIGVAAVFSPKMTVKSGGKNFVLFNVTIRATTLANLNYTF